MLWVLGRGAGARERERRRWISPPPRNGVFFAERAVASGWVGRATSMREKLSCFVLCGACELEEGGKDTSPYFFNNVFFDSCDIPSRVRSGEVPQPHTRASHLEVRCPPETHLYVHRLIPPTHINHPTFISHRVVVVVAVVSYTVLTKKKSTFSFFQYKQAPHDQTKQQRKMATASVMSAAAASRVATVSNTRRGNSNVVPTTRGTARRLRTNTVTRSVSGGAAEAEAALKMPPVEMDVQARSRRRTIHSLTRTNPHELRRLHSSVRPTGIISHELHC